MTKLLDRLIGHAKHVEVHNRIVARTFDDVDHSGQERLDRIAGHDATLYWGAENVGKSPKPATSSSPTAAAA